MRTVLSAFTERAVAEAAAARLREQALTRGAIAVRVRGGGSDPSIGHPVDELVTGGGLTDFVWLLDQLFASAGASRPEGSVADVVKDGGAVVTVDAETDEQAEQVQAFLLREGASKQASVPREGDLD